MEKVEVEEVTNEFNTGLSRAIRIGGATASITIIALILHFLKIIPEQNVSLAIGFFVSLPLIYSFIFGIIFNKPNFSSIFRHYSFTAYLIISLVLFMVVLKPSSIIEVVRYLFHFILGFIFAIIGYFFYATSYRFFSKKVKIKKYRWLALISFGISFLFTFTVAFILRHFNIFNLI